VHARQNRRPAAGEPATPSYWKLTGKVLVLCVNVVSPGTWPTVALSV
jgi:hypothetical protein